MLNAAISVVPAARKRLLIKEIVEKFCPAFARGGVVISVSKETVTAIFIAVLVDSLQIRYHGTSVADWMFNSSEWGKIALNGAGLIAALRLLGFNWVLLPVFLLKLVPGVSVLPVWTTYTAYRAWRGNPPAASRRRGPPTEIIDAEIVEEIRPTNNNRL